MAAWTVSATFTVAHEVILVIVIISIIIKIITVATLNPKPPTP